MNLVFTFSRSPAIGINFDFMLNVKQTIFICSNWNEIPYTTPIIRSADQLLKPIHTENSAIRMLRWDCKSSSFQISKIKKTKTTTQKLKNEITIIFDGLALHTVYSLQTIVSNVVGINWNLFHCYVRFFYIIGSVPFSVQWVWIIGYNDITL